MPFQLGPDWTSGPQPVEGGGWVNFGLGLTAIGLVGQHQFSTGKRGWDYLIGGVRRAEEYSPGRVLRTFQLSHLLSPLEQASHQYRFITPATLSGLRTTTTGLTYLEHISRLAGRDITQTNIISKGIRFEGGQLLIGRTGDDVLLRHAGIIRSPTGAQQQLQHAYARSLAGGSLFGGTAEDELNLTKKAFGQKISFIGSTGKQAEEMMFFTGGQSRLQAAKRFASGYGGTLAERLNQLARAPFELPVLRDIFTRIPLINRLQLGVIPSSGLKTVGKMTAKLGILGYAGYLSYQTIDYWARKSEALDNTLLAEGTTAAVGTLWTRGQVAKSKIADFFGLHDYRERQEEVAPGSTNISTLLAFPIIGGLTGAGIGYLQRVGAVRRFEKQGMELGQASAGAALRGPMFKQALYGTNISTDLLSVADDRTIEAVRQLTREKIEGISGRIAKKLPRFLGEMTPSKIKTWGGVALGAALVLPFLPGALIPSKRPEELEAIYSGEELVPIRKGRWWEAGRSPWEGKGIDRYRRHWYPRMLDRAKERSIWGEDEPSPLKRWWIENMTYELEQKHYRDRPYPITGAAFADIPILGPILSATVGRLVKPPRLMHEEEWMRGGSDGTSYARMPRRFEEEDLSGMGEIGPDAPISPFGLKGTIGEQVYRMTEYTGLPGFAMASIKERITGRQDVFDQEMMLQSAQKLYGASREFWDLDLGGLAGTSELMRRLVPHRRRQIEEYNPIKNRMPDWLPGPGDKSPDFLHGDPYTKIPEGELRLPGRGWEIQHPEVEGVDPANYPAIHRYAILSDVAPWSAKYDEALQDVRADMAQKKLTQDEIEWFRTLHQQVKQKKLKKEFQEYKFIKKKGTPIQELLAEANEASKEKDSEYSWFERTVGKYWEGLTHGAETPLEYLTPISPANKFVHARSAVEDYERTQIWGTQSAFWQHPIRDFIKPTTTATAHALGWEGIPSEVQEKRDIEKYFDALKYVKYTKLTREAAAQGDIDLAREFAGKRRETLFGLDPFSRNYTHIYRALPRRDRDYFKSFAAANLEDRAKIVKMVPENEQALMIAQWKLRDAKDLQTATKKGLLTEDQIEASKAAVEEMYEEKESEGMPKDKELWAQYVSTRMAGETYPDWYRRVFLLPKALEGRNLPGPDWVGWNAQVSLEDIKLKVVEKEARNLYDYDLWPDRQRIVARRPFIAEAAEELEDEELGPEDIKRRIAEVLNVNGITGSQIVVGQLTGGSGNEVDIDLQEDRTADIMNMYRKGRV